MYGYGHDSTLSPHGLHLEQVEKLWLFDPPIAISRKGAESRNDLRLLKKTAVRTGIFTQNHAPLLRITGPNPQTFLDERDQ